MYTKNFGKENVCLEGSNEVSIRGLTSLDSACPHLESFNLSFCSLSNLPKIIFSLKHLTQLNISNNYLQCLPDEIGNLHNLLILNLSGNKLTSLPDSIKHIHNLNLLDISSNEFIYVPNVLYYSLGVIRILNLSFNKILEFSCAPQCINNLRVLKLSYNKLKELPKWILYSMCQMMSFDISGNDIFSDCKVYSFCTAGIFESLQILNAENCKLECEKFNFLSSFKNIQVLRLGNNNKTERSGFQNYLGNLNLDSLKNLKILKCLYLQSAHVSSLPTSFGCMKNLEVLDLSDNLLTWLPECLCDLVPLRVLNLTSNQLFFLPNNINKLVNLKELHLGNNNLCCIPQGVYSLDNLEYVDFYNNKIDEIDFEIIKKKNLKGIDLGLNCLKYNFSDCDDIEIKMKYECLKNGLREHLNYLSVRSDIQILNALSEDSSTGSHISRYSDGAALTSDSEENVAPHQKHCGDNFEEENWEEEIISVEEDDLFNPNEVRYVSPSKGNYKEDWSSEFRNNYCPADNHVPSFMETYARNVIESASKHKIVDGQFDSD